MRYLFLVILLCSCGLRSGGKRLPDGGYIGTPNGCNKEVGEGNRVLEPADAPFSNINALRFDAEGNLYVLNRTASSSYISVFTPSPDNDPKAVLGKTVLHDGIDFARAGDGTFWVAMDPASNGANPEVAHLNASGQLISKFDVTADELGGLALSPTDDSIYVSFGRIAQLQPDGGVVRVFGSKPPYTPHYQGLAFDGRGKLWATEPIERTCDQFEANGDRLSQFGGHGTGPAMFDGTSDVHAGPTDVAFDAEGNLYVNDPLGSRIMKVGRTGDMLGEFSFGGVENVEPIAIDPKTGNVFVGRDNGVDIICPL